MLVPISILIYLYLIYHITSSILITCIVFGIILIARHIYLLWSGPQKPSSRAEYESIPPARIDGWGETATSGTSRRIYATPTSMAFAAFHYHTFLFRRRYSPRDPIYNTSHLVHAHMHPYLRMSATQLAAALRRKEITCVELIKLYIEHILKVNRYLNAMVHHRFDLALREATAVDHVLSTWNGRKELPQFLGVPCSVKECLEMEGFPNTSGLLGRTPLTATSTSPVIARMQKAGFIVMGTTNTSELCMWYESNNPVYGCTLNPYDLARISGGSSGGEGSIIGACGVPCGVGSDVGGSIRMPAYFNGIFGHKPTGGTVPNTGQHPKHVGAIERYCQAGPMCRYAEDLWPMLKLLAGPDHTNNEYQHIPGWLEDESMVPENVDMSSLTVLSLVEIDTWMITGLDPELKLAQEHAVEHFRSLGAQIKHIRIDEMRQAFVYWSAIVSIEHPIAFRIQLSENLSHHRHWYTRIVSSSSIWIAYELFTLIFQYPEKSAFTFPALFLSWLEIVPEWFPHQSSIEAARGRMFVSQLQSMMMGEKHVDDIHDLKPGHDSWGNIKQQRQATKTCSIVSNVNFHPPPKPKHTHHHTILLAPSHPVLTPRHHWSIIRPFNCMYTAIFNVAQLPVTQVPFGLSKPASGSLPLGVQVVGAFGMDHVTIACALELERKFGGYAYPRATRV